MSTLVGKALLAIGALLGGGATRRVRVQHRPATAPSVRLALPDRPELASHQLTRMRGALGMVLRHHPHVRRVMPSLAVLDRALAMGPHALERVPAAWLKDASVRLDALVGDWSSDGLRQLREYLRSRCKQPAEQKGSTKPPQRPDY